MIRDPEIREAAERLAAEWARSRVGSSRSPVIAVTPSNPIRRVLCSIGTLPSAAEVPVVEYTLAQLADPESPHGEVLDLLCRSRWTQREVPRVGTYELPL